MRAGEGSCRDINNEGWTNSGVVGVTASAKTGCLISLGDTVEIKQRIASKQTIHT